MNEEEMTKKIIQQGADIKNIKENLSEFREENRNQFYAVRNLISEWKALTEKRMDKTDDKLETKADKDNFEFWRNILVAGILITIFTAVIIGFITK